MAGNPKNLMPPWKPGQSGNPGGRPRKKPISDRYMELAETVLPDDLRRKLKLPEKATYGDAVALRIFHTAIGGKHEAARELREAIEGRAPQALHVSGPGLTVKAGGQPVRAMKQFTPEQLAAVVKMAAKAAAQEQEIRSGDAKPG